MNLKQFEPKRILVGQLRQIGDVVQSTIAVEMLAKRYPKAEIEVLTEAKCAPVFAHNPHVARVHALDKKVHSGVKNGLAFARAVAQSGGGHDLLVDFQQLPRLKPMALFSRARVKLSFYGKWYNRPLYTHLPKADGSYAGLYKVSILEPLGMPWDGQQPKVYLSDDERAWAASWLAEHGVSSGQLITLDPSHRRNTRRWPAAHFAGLADALLAEHPELRFYLVYGPDEQAEAAAVRQASRSPEAFILPDSVHSLRELSAVLETAKLHVGNCSAPRHLAVAVGTPSLAILGATGRSWTFPAPEHGEMALRTPCWHCNLNTCPEADASGAPPCLTGLTPQAVLPAALEMLHTGRLTAHRMAP